MPLPVLLLCFGDRLGYSVVCLHGYRTRMRCFFFVLHNYSFHVLLRHMVFSFVQDVWDRIRDGHRRQGKGALLAELLGHDDTNDWSDADDARR